jgi:hypothetical protein
VVSGGEDLMKVPKETEMPAGDAALKLSDAFDPHGQVIGA